MEKPKAPVIDLLHSDSDRDPDQSRSRDPHPDPEQSQGQDAEVEVELYEKKPIPSAEPDVEDIVDEPGRMEVEDGAKNARESEDKTEQETQEEDDDEEEEDEIEGMYVGSWTTPEV